MYRHAPSTDRVHPVVCLAAGWRAFAPELTSTEPELSKSHLCRSKKNRRRLFFTMQQLASNAEVVERAQHRTWSQKRDY